MNQKANAPMMSNSATGSTADQSTKADATVTARAQE